MTSRNDIAALNRLSQEYIGELKSYMRNIKHQGEALILDDEQEKVSIVKVQPRRTLHGGGEQPLMLNLPEETS